MRKWNIFFEDNYLFLHQTLSSDHSLELELQRFTNSSIRFDSDTKDADSIIFDSICFLLTADVHI